MDSGAGEGDGNGSGTRCDGSESTGDVPKGVSSGLGSLDPVFSAFGVLGLADACGACTTTVSVEDLTGSGFGTGVCAIGECIVGVEKSRGVETVEPGVGIGEEVALGAGAMSCSRARFASGGFVALS